MAMDLGTAGTEGADDGLMMDINTTPLIDVMLVLIIMLIITIPVQLHAVVLHTPRTAASPEPQRTVEVTLVIAANGQWLWDGEPLRDQADLESRLTALAASPEVQLQLQPEADAPYEVVAVTLSSAQRLGVTRLGLGNLAAYGR